MRLRGVGRRKLLIRAVARGGGDVELESSMGGVCCARARPGAARKNPEKSLKGELDIEFRTPTDADAHRRTYI